jgi:hypothetical protein
MWPVKLLAAVSLVLLLTTSTGANVYTWTDENGVRHYSNVAPSESATDIQKDDELNPGGPPGSGSPPAQPLPQTASPENPEPSAEPPGEAGPGPKNTVGDSATGGVPGLSLDNFPISQDVLVGREKTLAAEMKRQLDDETVTLDELMASEKERLLNIIEMLEEAPLIKFGSQRNKIRQVGYFKYRLETLMNNPEQYFNYAESSTD